jgi:hypothetical protein
LRLVVNGITSANAYAEVNLNGDTGTNYSRTVLSGNGSVAASFRASNEAAWFIDNAGQASAGAFFILDIMSYSNTTTNKTGIARMSDAAVNSRAGVFLWRNTNAITSIAIKNPVANFLTGSTFTLYGIKSF